MRTPRRSDAPGRAGGRQLRAALVLAAALLSACRVTPLTNKIAVGDDPYVVGVGEGPDGATDLFAAPAGGGGFVRLTFNRLAESAPALSSDGLRVAYLRRTPGREGVEAVVLDLTGGRERRIPLPEATAATRVGWLADGTSLVVGREAGGVGVVRQGSTTVAAVDAADAATADSALQVVLGEPPAATIVACATGLCVRTAAGEVAVLDSLGRGAIRWGGDSVGYFGDHGFEVRPLRGGRSRYPAWKDAPANPRDLTYHGGRAARTAPER